MGQKFGKKTIVKKLALPKLVAQFQKYHIPYLKTLPDLSISLYITKNTILIHCRSTLIHWRTYLNTLTKLFPILIPYPMSQNFAETYPILIHGRETLLGPGQKSAAIAYLNRWRVSRPARLINFEDENLTVVATCFDWSLNFDFWIRATVLPQGNPIISDQKRYQWETAFA